MNDKVFIIACSTERARIGGSNLPLAFIGLNTRIEKLSAYTRLSAPKGGVTNIHVLWQFSMQQVNAEALHPLTIFGSRKHTRIIMVVNIRVNMVAEALV